MSEKRSDLTPVKDAPEGRHYLGSLEKVIKEFEAEPSTGLSASEVQSRLEEYGPNKLKEEKKIPVWRKFLEQFKDVMVAILLVAAVISGFVLNDWFEAAIIMAIVLVNAVLGVVQEGRAEEAVEALQSMSAPLARVLRDGKQQEVKAEAIVPGDILILEAGDIIPADSRIIEGTNLKAEEAALTGESVPVDKDASFITDESIGIGDRENMLFQSTSVTYGRGKAMVVATGEQTEMGKIAGSLSSMEQELTPLQQNINALGKVLAVFMLAVVAITFVVGILQGGDILDMFMISVSLAVAAIPEGLSAVITIVLALGMNRMASENAIVKRLLAVETLGSVNVICSDKTGTLTQNEMTVTRIYAGDRKFEVSGSGYKPEGVIKYEDGEEVAEDSVLERLLTIGALCNEAELREVSAGIWDILGDPTEGAMLTVAGKAGITREQMAKEMPRLGDLPFDSDRKMMSVFHKNSDGTPLSLTKGAPDIIIDRCNSELTTEGVRPLTAERKEEILAQNSAYAQTALRVLAFAYSVHEDEDFSDAEEDLIYVGLMGMIDPPREEARLAIAECHSAGIRAVMITGDYRETAVAIAKDLKLMQDGQGVLTGNELETMSDEELRKVVGTIAVYARVSPEHKTRIVEALQAEGNIVSMTGDGVNDAPALKRADIGVAMGITGTEVSKSAADMILTDDSFATIVSAVEEGRIIYANIRKFVGFLLSCNVGEILVIFLTMLIMGPQMIPLQPVQLLWLNLITDSFPALALGQEAGEPDIMDRKPRSKRDRILDKEMILSIAVQAVAIFIAVFIAFNLGLNRYGAIDLDAPSGQSEFYVVEDSTNNVIHEETGTVYLSSENFTTESGEQRSFGPSAGALTYAFITLIMCELLRAYSSRSEHYSVFRIGLFSNKNMLKATAISLALTLAVIYIPFLQPFFQTISLGLNDWLPILGLALIPFVIGELFKLIYHRGDDRAKVLES